MSKIGGVLEVGRTEDTHEVFIVHSKPTLDQNGAVRIVVSPRHARYLANLLTEQATYAEEETNGVPSGTSDEPKTRDKRSSRPK